MVKNAFSLPRIDDIIDQLSQARHFSKIDLQTVFWQIKIRENDKNKTAFITHEGFYEFNVLYLDLVTHQQLYSI